MLKDLKELKKSELGFTLIEVMVVIIMVGILAAIAVPLYSNYVYRARASEGVTTLGAVKTYMLERANATGKWPNQAQLDDEFNDFKDMYYFSKPVLKPASLQAGTLTTPGPPITTTQQVAVMVTVNPPNFGKTGDTLQIDIDLSDAAANNGWSGTVRQNWAKHLPLSAGPLT